MNSVTQQKIEFKKERNLLQLINDSIHFIGKNFTPLSKGIYSIIIPVLLLLFIYNFLPDKISASPICYDIVNIIFRIKFSLGFNGIFIMLIAYLESVLIYYYMQMYYQSSEGTTIVMSVVFKRIKENSLSLISLLFVLLVGFGGILLALIYFDVDIVDMFGFSLFYILVLFVPFLCYFFLSTLFVGITEDLNCIEAFQKVKSFLKNSGMIWANTAAILLGFVILQKMITSTLGVLYALLSIDLLIKIYPLLLIVEQLITASIISVFIVMIAFLYMSEEEKMKGKSLLTRIDEIS